MALLELTLACGTYGPVRALTEGRIQPEGVHLHWVDLSPEELMWRLLQHGEFDAAELSLPSYLVAREAGLALRAIPIFPCRAFRHSALYVRAAAGIAEPRDLAGRRVGLPEYQMAVALWVRGILEHDYGVPAREIQWVAAGLARPGRVERLPLRLPPEIRVEHVADRTLNDLLAAGQIDALISTHPPEAIRRGDGSVRRLFSDVRQVEMEWFGRTGLFPIMHTFVIRAAVLERHPWVAASLLDAFHLAKEHWCAAIRAEADRPLGLPWMADLVQTVVALIGTDFWPYGVQANRHVLETAIHYAQEQGLISQLVPVADLFVPGTLEPVT